MRALALLLVFILAAPLAVEAQQPEPAEKSGPAAGFVTKDSASTEPKPVELPVEDLGRYEGVLAALANAIENEDVEAYEALMSPRLLEQRRLANDPLSGMMEFMTAVMATRGGFASFHELGTKAYSLPGCEYPLLNAVFHLEDGMAGSMGIALDDDDRVDEFSLFVKEDICPLGAACDRPKQALAGHDE